MEHKIAGARMAESFKMSRPVTHWNVGDSYDLGAILLPEGIVEAYMQGDADNSYHTRLDIVYRHRHYMITFPKRYTRVGVVRVARQTLAQILCGA